MARLISWPFPGEESEIRRPLALAVSSYGVGKSFDEVNEEHIYFQMKPRISEKRKSPISRRMLKRDSRGFRAIRR